MTIAKRLAALALALCLFLPAAPAHGQEGGATRATVQPLFTPGQDVTAAVVARLDKARGSVLVQAYSFTSQPRAEALIRAHQRRVLVAVIVDKGQRAAKGGQAGRLAQAGVQVYVDAAHAIAHNKVMVIDQRTVLAGSFNWTASAQARNAENLMAVNSRQAAQEYAHNWLTHLAHSQPWAVAD
ncbi:MAG: phospholipase D family protein [Desulfarculus sp.]|nr:phospholipase D family protein [Desulfarculus sp.]